MCLPENGKASGFETDDVNRSLNSAENSSRDLAAAEAAVAEAVAADPVAAVAADPAEAADALKLG